MVTDRSTIIKYYLKHDSIYDFIYFISVLFFNYNHYHALEIPKVFLIKRILFILNKLEEIMNFKNKAAAIKNLTILFVLILYVAHLCGCLFAYVASYEI
jgi:hypothetical protein